MTQCCTHCDGDRHHKTVAGLIERPRYSPGLILQDSDLTAAVDYTRELNRTLFRSLFGCGVICGLDVSIDDTCEFKVTVNAGLALDGCGDPIQVPAPATIVLTQKDNVMVPRGGQAPDVKNFWIVLCGKEKYCAPRPIMCDADDANGASQPTRIRSLAEISIAFKRPKCVCECSTPEDDPSEAELDDLANRMLPPAATAAALAAEAGQAEPYLPDCQAEHATSLACRCDCGECVLLAWAHWFPTLGWGVLHRGVRRFIRPMLIAPDPIEDKRPVARAVPVVV